MNIRRRLDALEILNPQPTQPTRYERLLSLQRLLGLPLPENSSPELLAEGSRRLIELQKTPDQKMQKAFAEFRAWALSHH